MERIKELFTDINESTYNVSELEYGDEVYIFINKSLKFSDLVKITMEEIIEMNSHGIVVRGFQTHFDKNFIKEKEYFTGIFVYKIKDGFILTSEGYKVPAFIDNEIKLLSYEYILDKNMIEWEFRIDNFFITLNLSGNVYFTAEETADFINKIEFETCNAYSDKIILYMNNFKIIYEPDEISIRYKNKPTNYEQFFNYISQKLAPINKAIYAVNKIYELKPSQIIISGYS